LLLSSTVAKNWKANDKEIKRQVATESEDFQNGDFFGSGYATASALTKLVGTVKY
jgi:hypothetical protein